MRRVFTCYSAVVWSFVFATTVGAQNLLDDPGFELASSGGQTSNSAWVLQVNFPDGADPAAQFQTAPWASNPGGTPGTGVWLRSFEGDQNPGDPTANATIYQDVAGSGGVEYVVSGWHKQETAYTAKSTLLGVEFFDGGSVSLGRSTLELNGMHPRDGSWIQFSLMTIAPAGTATVRAFAEMIEGVEAQQNPQSAMLDDFSLMVVPPTAVESVTWGQVRLHFR